MKKSPIILMISLLAFTTAGCGLLGGGESEQAEESPQPEVSPVAPPSPSPQTFGQSAQAGTSSTDVAALGLIPSTNPNQRRQEIQKGRESPFAVLPIRPTITRKVAQNGVTNPERLCQVPPQPPVTVAQAPSVGTPDIAPPPIIAAPKPIPNEARGVFVSGVIKVNGTLVAIVQAPGETVARNVTVGATLANGQVLVKAINANLAKPTVTLEQYGVNVIRTVGEAPEEPIELPPTVVPRAPTAAEPPPAPQVPPPGPDGFGRIRNLVLLTLNIGDVVIGEKGSNPIVAVSGILCNEGLSSLNVRTLLWQVEDKTTGVVIDTFKVTLADVNSPPFVLQPGQKAEFDGSIPKLRGRNRGDLKIKLVGWS